MELQPRVHNHSQFLQEGIFAAGLDEAGRGCLAGPVVAFAVILPQTFQLPGLDDSKKLSPYKRSILEKQIYSCAVSWGLGVVWPDRIDQINILQASLEAMAIAVSWLKILPGYLLVDGNQSIPDNVLNKFWQLRKSGQIPNQKTIVGGDGLIPAISAASILAKTFRDRLMVSLSRLWPDYGFERHKGYGTKEHFKALKTYGPCKMHRLSFRGVQPIPSRPVLC